MPNNVVRDAFAADYSMLSQLWEAISPDPILVPLETDYRWLSPEDRQTATKIVAALTPDRMDAEFAKQLAACLKSRQASLSISFQRTFQMETADQFNRQQLLLARAEGANIQTYLSGMKDELLNITHTTSLFRAYRDVDLAVLSDVLFKNTGKIKKCIRFFGRQGDLLYTRGLGATAGALPDLAALSKELCPDGVLVQQDTRHYSLIAPACRKEAGVDAVMITIDIQDLAQTFLGPIKSGERGYAWIMDGNGNLLYHPSQPGMVGRNLCTPGR